MNTKDADDGTNGREAIWPTEEDRVRAAAQSYTSGETDSMEALSKYFGLEVELLELRQHSENWDWERRKLTEGRGTREPDRTPDGRFRPGHGVKSPGRPRREEEGTWLDLLREEVTSPRWTAIVRKAIEQALRGDARARAWLSDYVLPPHSELPAPDQRIEVVYESLTTAIDRMEREDKLREAAEDVGRQVPPP